MDETRILSSVVALETLLARKRRAGAELLDLEMYERYGQGADPKMNEALLTSTASSTRASAVVELEALVARLRSDEPEAVIRWAAAHIELLRDFVDANESAAPNSHASVGVFTAGQEIAAWAEVRDGARSFVDENVFYVRLDRGRYRALLGVDL